MNLDAIVAEDPAESDGDRPQGRILFITSDDPELTASGSQVRTHCLYEAVKRLGEVTVFVPPRERKVTPWQWFFRGLTKVGMAQGTVAPAKRGERFDAVVVRYARTAGEFAAWRYGPLYLDIDDLPSEAFELEAARLPIWARWFARLVVKAWQRWIFKKCAGCWVVKKEDAKWLPKGLRWEVLRNISLKRPSENSQTFQPSRPTLLTVGLMSYWPNAEGVTWFLKAIWPPFHAQHPDWRFEIAGGGMGAELKQLCAATSGVTALGFVDDLGAAYARASAVVAPILTGAGSCVKVAESTLHGKVTLVTPQAIRGIESSDVEKLGFRVFDSAAAFAAAMESLISLGSEGLASAEAQIRAMAQEYNSFEGFVEKVVGLRGRAGRVGLRISFSLRSSPKGTGATSNFSPVHFAL